MLTAVLLIGSLYSCKKDGGDTVDSNTDEVSQSSESETNGGEGTEDTNNGNEDNGGGDEGNGNGNEGNGGGDGNEDNGDGEPVIIDGDVYAMKSFDTKLMSFNILQDSTYDSRWDAMADFIMKSDASVVCMQEVQNDQFDYFKTALAEKYETIWYTRQSDRKSVV